MQVEVEGARDNQVHRGGENMKVPKVLKEYINVYSSNTEFFTTYSPSFIENKLHNYLVNSEQITYIKSDTKFKTVYEPKPKNGDSDSSAPKLKVSFKIRKVCDSKVCIELKKVSGDKF